MRITVILPNQINPNQIYISRWTDQNLFINYDIDNCEMNFDDTDYSKGDQTKSIMFTIILMSYL